MVTAMTAANMVVIFGLQLVIAKLFGATRATDAFFLATGLPSLVATVLVGSLNVSLIPSFSELRESGGEAAAWLVMSRLFVVLCSLVVIVAATIAFAAPLFARMLAPSYGPEELALTASLMRLSAPSIAFLTLSGMMTSLLYTQGRFALGSAAVALNNVLILALALVLAPRGGVAVLAAGLSAGALLQFGIVLWGLRGHLSVQVAGAFRDSRVWSVLGLVVPLLAGSAVYKSDVLFGRVLAATLPRGELSWVSYSQRIAGFLITLTGAGVSTVVFPQLARHTARGDRSSVVRDSSLAVGYIALFAGAAVTVVAVVAPGAVTLFLQRGAFTAADSAGTARALVAFAGMIYANALAGTYSNVLYSMKRVKTVVGIGLVGFGVYVALALQLVRSLGFVGVPLAASISAVVTLAIYVYQLRRLGIRIPLRWLSVVHGRLALASVVAVLIGSLVSVKFNSSALATSLVSLVVAGVFVAVLAIIGSPEARSLLSRLRQTVA